MIDRNTVHEKCFDLISTCGEFKTLDKDEAVKMWSDVLPHQMPYLGMLEMSEELRQEGNGRQVLVLRPEFYIYVDAGNSNSANPYKVLNPILDKVTELFQPKNNRLQNLGGIVHSVKIIGGIEKFGAEIGSIGAAIVPLEIIIS